MERPRRVAVVSGSSSGIVLATAEVLLKEGWAAFLNSASSAPISSRCGRRWQGVSVEALGRWPFRIVATSGYYVKISFDPIGPCIVVNTPELPARTTAVHETSARSSGAYDASAYLRRLDLRKGTSSSLRLTTIGRFFSQRISRGLPT